MAINNNDVKLFESQRLSDEEDGGGRVTGREVIDGNVNNLFQDISRIDRTVGDVALRKAFIGISTDNNDTYLGSHLILTEPPKDKNVSVLLFNTDSQTDERNDARDRIEGYVVPSIRASWELVGDQLKGQRAIVGYQREELAIPEIGEVYKLNTPDGQTSQYVRVTSVDHSVVTFTYNNGSEYVDFERRKIEMQISAPLIETFPGTQPVPGVPGNSASLVQTTQVADSSRYYSIQPVSASITAGDLTIKTESVMRHWCPAPKWKAHCWIRPAVTRVKRWSPPPTAIAQSAVVLFISAATRAGRMCNVAYYRKPSPYRSMAAPLKMMGLATCCIPAGATITAD